jgi:HSP20 family protein
MLAMAVVRWDRLRGMMALRDEMNSMFDDGFFGEGAGSSRGGKPIAWAPPIDVVESRDKVIVSAELPGMKAEEVELSVDDGQLTLKGERGFPEEAGEESLHRIERSYGYFERRIALPGTIDAGKVTASYADGVLRVELPKIEKARPRQIRIKVESTREIEAESSGEAGEKRE